MRRYAILGTTWGDLDREIVDSLCHFEDNFAGKFQILTAIRVPCRCLFQDLLSLG